MNETTSNTVETPTAETTTENATLAIADIENAVKVIDHACNEGAFKGWNLIGEVHVIRSRLAAFVEATKTAKENADKNAEENTEEPTKETRTE